MPVFPYKRMVVAERSELWRPETDREPAQFVETTVIWRADAEFFLQHTPIRYDAADEVDFSDGDLRRIDPAHVYPSHQDYPMAPSHKNRYVERPSCIEYDFREGPYVEYPRDAFQRQARAVRRLLDDPHRNVTAFFGCGKDWYWMDALVFGRYGRSLAALAPAEVRALDAAHVQDGIRAGVAYLHDGGTVHMALYPPNIRFDRRGNPIIVNFRHADAAGAPATYGSIELIEDMWTRYRVQEDAHEDAQPARCVPTECFEWMADGHLPVQKEVDHFGLFIMRDFFRNPEKYQGLKDACRRIWWDCRRRGHIGLTCCEIYGRRDTDLPEDSDDNGSQASASSREGNDMLKGWTSTLPIIGKQS